MSNIDTSAVDQGSADSIVHDIVSPVNEMAMAWYSAVTGKGVATGATPTGGQYVTGLQPGATVTEVTAPPAIVAVTESPLFSPLVLIAIAAVIIFAMMAK